ncbi:sugar phosphate nucleotidyltransferase [Chlorobium phaeovibrioides]|uniref:UDP-N-acetylglucosamine pyrophosphorylase n=2 Tax=Chlorobium phaeovibrioides TaxID=1094 RepID=A0A3S0NB38_CHLPH|nr:sugar phosphate nucleotidyltransferase [Chlorobium phaeovibrioides]QEQ56464.1 UDP-N-acetylglucosamine pyrophosphorylase [Chlorobium phaeovibrioides]RTY39052.1 UDP-N-acetylglucosamine pyrophosphorylase [Chlorobium phaeovibrioides]HCD35939.1 UDP-N-acetylglucosamine pyrophosphorylase [Chlorobium sp.]
MPLAIVIMAGGKGTRMQSDLPKVLHKAAGRALIEHVIDKSQALDPEKIILIVGHQAELVKDSVKHYPVACALQEPQLGTGHAVMQAEEPLQNFQGEVLILSGDAPLFTLESLQNLIRFHRESDAQATVLTAEMENPTGYGRVIRKPGTDSVEKIVEQKDATEEEKTVKEINSGVYVFNAETLFSSLKEITTNNAQNEYYLTDVFGVCFRKGSRVAAWKTPNPDEIHGINTPQQLAHAERLLKK